MSISIYDGDETHLLNWTEFLAFLAGKRNPYVTVALLPKVATGQINDPSVIDPQAGTIKKSLLEALTSAAREEELQVGPVDQEGGSTPR